MSFLNELSPEQSKLLVSLPYRVGYRVSQSDTSGGEESDEQELLALSNILTGFAGEMFGCETIQYIMSESLKYKDEWQQWHDNIDNVEAECAQAVSILAEHVDAKEVSGVKRHLMQVGEAVALAFREIEELTFVEKIKLQIRYNKLKFEAEKSGQPYKTFEQFLNISPAEREALKSISTALDIKYAI